MMYLAKLQGDEYSHMDSVRRGGGKAADKCVHEYNIIKWRGNYGRKYNRKIKTDCTT